MNKLLGIVISLIYAFFISLAYGQSTFPNKPVHIVIPFPPGGSTDVLGRLLGASMSNNLGQSVIVENTGGAGGTIGATKVARSPADGYTLLFHNMAHASAPALYSKLPYNPIQDFEPIGIVTEVPMILVARKNFPGNNLSDVLAYAKTNGDKLNFANAGVGATSQLCEALLKSATGSKWTSVPYKGTGPALNDLLGGQVDFICDQPASTISHIKAGNLKPIAVATKNRLKILPQVATFSESGLPGFELTVWHGLYAPKGTPKEVVDRLAVSLRDTLKDPVIIERYQDMSASIATPAQATPEALQNFLKADVERWKTALKAAGIQAE
ncbi:MAG: tripartite tricarboxylate transporter substrate-binding protein [Betaproteobacteria bacterium]